MAHYPKAALDAATQHKIDTVIAYVLHPGYQALDDGYGVMRAGPRRYYAIGWSAHLPGYSDRAAMRDGHAKSLIQRLEVMAHFPDARRHRWFRESLAHLESFRAEDGTYRFPSRYLKESPSGYWVTGAYMRLEENRRRRVSLTLDSTFRMMVLKRLQVSG